MYKYKEEATCMNDNQTKDTSDNNTTVKRDIKENLGTGSSGYNRAKFINDIVLQQTIRFACCIAGAKVGLKGYDCLDVISSDILRSNFLEH